SNQLATFLPAKVTPCILARHRAISPSIAFASAVNAYCLCLRHKRHGPRLPKSSMDGSNTLAFVCIFLFSPLLPCAAPSTVEGEDRSFLRHQRAPLKLPSPVTSHSTASAAPIARVRHCCSYSPPPLSFESSTVDDFFLPRWLLGRKNNAVSETALRIVARMKRDWMQAYIFFICILFYLIRL
ncbi:hypothetical protein BHE74_00005737, partial [Ensete ventricosum]